MSRRNAKLARIIDLQCKQSSATLTKKDLTLIVQGLRELDKSKFTSRDFLEYENLVKYLSNLAYSKK